MRKLILAVVVIVLCGAFVFGQEAAQPPKVDRAAIQARIVALTQQRESLIANVHACDGAIEDCQYWLSVLDKSEAEKVK